MRSVKGKLFIIHFSLIFHFKSIIKGITHICQIEGTAHFRCKWCNKDLKGGKTIVERHAGTEVHKKNATAVQGSQTSFFERTASLNSTIRALEISFCLYVVEHDDSINSIDHLVALFKNFYSKLHPESSKIHSLSCNRTKATKIIQRVIGNENEQRIVQKMKTGPFSLLVDESTDITSSKLLTVVVRCVNKDFLVADEFLCLLKVTDFSAVGLHTVIKKWMTDREIPYVQNMIALAADNASVMVGEKESVAALFKKEIPNLFIIRCTCHSLARCAFYATAKLPYEVEKLLQKVYAHFKYSSKRLHNFEHVQEILNMKILKILKLATTRWLSLNSCVQRFLDLLPALKKYFQNELEYFNNKFKLIREEAELKKSVEEIYSLLTHVDTELYLRFLRFVLPVICNLNAEFQAETPRIHVLYARMNEVCQTLLKCYIKADVIHGANLTLYSNPANFLPTNEIYAGPYVAAYLETNPNLTPTKLNMFYTNVRNFYIELLQQIFKRFPFEGSAKAFKQFAFLDPQALKSFKSLAPAAVYVYPEANLQELDTEFRLLLNNESLDFEEKDTIKFWKDVSRLKRVDGSLLYPHIIELVKRVLTLPHSTACVERIFSRVTDNKTKKRNRLEEETLSGILHGKNLLKMEKKSCFDFDVSKTEMLSYFNSKVMYD